MTPRLARLAHGDLGPEARQLWDSITGGRRSGVDQLIGPDGALAGPFDAMLHSPAIGRHCAALGEAIRFESVLEDRLRELATICVARFWRSDYEWAAHRPLARRAGISDEVILAVAGGGEPTSMGSDEAATLWFTRELLEAGRVGDAAYRAAVDHLGETGVVELTFVVGYYTLVALTLNAFCVPAPDDATPPWT